MAATKTRAQAEGISDIEASDASQAGVDRDNKDKNSVAGATDKENLPKKYRHDKITPLPKAQSFVLVCILLAEAINVTQLFPYLAFLVEHFHVSDNPKDTGYYMGFVASTFMFMQFLSASWWGRLSDTHGRRPVLLLGLACNAIFTTLFGLAPNFWTAVVVRGIAGLANGNVGVAKSYLREFTDETNQAKGFSLMSLCWGGGVILGPILGGLLYDLSGQYPSAFGSSSLLQRFPALPPCLVVSLLCVVGFTVGLRHLSETRPSKSNVTLMAALSISARQLPQKLTACLKGGSKQQQGNSFNNENVGEDGDVNLVQMDSLAHDEEKGDSKEGEVSASKANWRNILFNREDPATGICIAAYSSMRAMAIMIDECIPLWAKTSVEAGGLAFEPKQIGYIMLCAGLSLLIFQVFIYYRLERRIGPKSLMQMGLMGASPALMFLPFLSNIFRYVSDEKLRWAMLFFASMWRTWTLGTSFTTVMILINNSAHEDMVGLINGYAQSVASLCSAVGPLVGGVVFAWSLQNGQGFPFDYHFIFLIGGCVMMSLVFLIRRAPQSVNHRKSAVPES